MRAELPQRAHDQKIKAQIRHQDCNAACCIAHVLKAATGFSSVGDRIKLLRGMPKLLRHLPDGFRCRFYVNFGHSRLPSSVFVAKLGTEREANAVHASEVARQ